MCEGFVSTAKQMGAYLNTDGWEWGINSTEVAVLCLMQKIMNEQDAWSSKMTIEQKHCSPQN